MGQRMAAVAVGGKIGSGGAEGGWRTWSIEPNEGLKKFASHATMMPGAHQNPLGQVMHWLASVMTASDALAVVPLGHGLGKVLPAAQW